MPKLLEKNLVVPFRPRSFPPRTLHSESFKKLLREANQVLKEFSTFLSLSPAPIQIFSSLHIVEAMDSLDSQKIGAHLTEVLQSPVNDSRSAPIKDYKEALEWACRNILIAPLSSKQICHIHQIVKRSSSSKSDLGKYRKRQNWIGPAGCSIDEAYFYPPIAEKVDVHMDRLFRYMNSTKKEPLLQLALSLAQLLIIHPFMDGNGRIARLLIPLFLYKKKVIPLPFFFLSGYFKVYRLRYFQTLFKTTDEENWDDWIAFFLKGIIITCKKHEKTLTHIISLYESIEMDIPELKQGLREFLFKNPIFSMASFNQSKGSISDFKNLKRFNYIRKIKNNKFSFTPLLKILYRK